MIKLKDLLKELESRDNYYIANNIMEPRLAVQKYFNANKDSLEVLMDQDRWDEVYQIIFNQFPQFEQHILSTAINSEALDAGWLTKQVPVDVKLSIDVNSTVGEIQATVSNWVGKNKKRLIKLADDDEYKNFYQAVKDAFPEVPEDKLLFAFNVAAVEHDIHYDVLTDGMIKLKDLLKETYKLSLKDLGHGDYKVIAIDNGKNIGELQFIKSKFKPVLKGASVVVDPNYQRQGIGSAMYVFAEKQLKLKFVKTDDVLTGSGKALWNDPNRKFGLKESIDLQNFKDLVYRYTHRERDSRYEILHQIVLGFEALQSHDDKTEAIELLKQADLYKYVQGGLTEAVSPHDQALSYTEQQALELTHKNWGSFTGKVCNSGFCDIYADKLSKLLPGSKKWDTEEQGPSGTLGHVWVEFKGKFYDAETPDGVSDWKELPWMQSFYKAKKQYPSDIKKL